MDPVSLSAGPSVLEGLPSSLVSKDTRALMSSGAMDRWDHYLQKPLGFVWPEPVMKY